MNATEQMSAFTHPIAYRDGKSVGRRWFMPPRLASYHVFIPLGMAVGRVRSLSCLRCARVDP
jgi:hypothetical protein